VSTPTPDETTPAPSVINWYFGPTAWDPRPDALWHAQCPDPYATGRDGEVWLDHHQGAFCSGCRHWEPGQAEQDIPADRAAEMQPATPANQTTTGTTDAGSPAMADATSSATTAAEEAGAASNAPADQESAAAASNAAAAPTAADHPGLLGRIEHALEGHGG
jgi:hypothetical protein